MTAAEATADVANERIELLVLTVGGHRCAFELGRVKQVVDYPRVTRVPGTPEAVDGVASVGGEVAAVLDIRRLFGLSGSDEPSFTLLDRKADAQAVGVVACHVDTVEVYPMAAIRPTSEYETDDGLPFVFDDRYVRAVLAANDPVPVMDADALVMAVAGDTEPAGRDGSDADELDAAEPTENEQHADDAPDADATDDADADDADAADADDADDADGADADDAVADDAVADEAVADEADGAVEREAGVGDDDDAAEEAVSDHEADTADDTVRQ